MISSPLIYIHFTFEEGPGGGGASFLLNLKKSLIERGNYTEEIQFADLVLFNSHHQIDQLIELRKKFPEKIFIHRIDGPMSLYNASDDMRDEIVKMASHHLADAYVFQSSWSQSKNKELDITLDRPFVIIGNAVDENIFKRKESPSFNGKLKLISSGWSTNPNKGFSSLLWMDENLDWSKYEMSYVGKTTHQFKNIKIYSPIDRQELANFIYNSDVYIFPSRFESCSNALLEAECVGIPVVAFAGSSNPEYVSLQKYLFKEDQELATILEEIRNNYKAVWDENQKSSVYKKLDFICEQYLSFGKSLLPKKKVKNIFVFKMKLLLWEIQLLSKIKVGHKIYNLRKDFFGQDASLYTVSNLMLALVNMVFAILMARFLPKEKMAIYPYFFSLQGLLSFVAIPGLDTMINKAAIIGDIFFIKRAFKRMLISTSLFALLFSVILGLLLKFSYYFSNSSSLYFLVFLGLPLLALERLEHALLGLNQFKTLAKYRFIFSMSFFVLGSCALFFSFNPLVIIGAYLLSKLLQALYGLFKLNFFLKGPKLIKSSVYNLKKESMRILFFNLFNTVIANLYSTILYHLSPIQLANYANGTKFSDKIKDYAKVIISAPLQKWLTVGESKFVEKMGFYASLYFLISFLLSFLLVLSAPFYIPFIFGEQYHDAILMAQFMSFAIPPKVAGSILQQREIFLEDNKWYIYTGYFQVILSIMILYPLIKTYHGLGVCIAILIQSYLAFVISFFRYIKWKKINFKTQS